MTPLAIGTAAERWAAAELDVLLGRITPRELWALGCELVKEAVAEQGERIEELEHELKETEKERDALDDEVFDLQAEVDELQDRVTELESQLEGEQ